MKHRYDSKKQLNLAVGENNSTHPLNSKIKTIAEEKQLNSATGTKQLNSTGENNSAQQQDNTTQLGSKYEITQLCAVVDRLQPPLQQNRLFLSTLINCYDRKA
ncbi:hypothetical protein TNCV_218441 [Trichonephila clavipes]|uniref:Uncharacterized protein n=1 Tax=Trichonephila clavipes TaxID=2585209 RepID=A0A8X6S0Z1_TRICX|nr:hypothetical protein TNCV_218441 [Trichonephila clavipes]